MDIPKFNPPSKKVNIVDSQEEMRERQASIPEGRGVEGTAAAPAIQEEAADARRHPADAAEIRAVHRAMLPRLPKSQANVAGYHPRSLPLRALVLCPVRRFRLGSEQGGFPVYLAQHGPLLEPPLYHRRLAPRPG
ncbi:unnamed protein product [Symbiodinium natans]|uniref:Uncharacterized protein n=1 Tax=Symbiodinium natans TaxID=878477 RepID=A0A812KTX1_9DINO|nr:unnamed protein product [Symbiodinium natans]